MDKCDTWRNSSERLLDHVLFQMIHCCWSIGITRQMTAIARRTGLLHDNESLSIQYLLNGVDRQHLRDTGAIIHPLNVKSFLVDQGTILDHLCPLTYDLPNQAVKMDETWDVSRFKVDDLIVHTVVNGNINKFNDEIARCLARSPVAVAIPCFESFKNIGNEIYIPRDEEASATYDGFHVMLCTGLGRENGLPYVELQDSSGEQRGQGGYIRVGIHIQILSHLIEITGINCTHVNPKTKFSASFTGDKCLYYSYIRINIAHAKMLAAKELITLADQENIVGGLQKINEQITSNNFTYWTDIEDVHVNIERALALLICEPAKNLHRACSLNDQVATAFRLWCREAIIVIVGKIKHLQATLVQLALKNKTLIIPLQRAQSVLLPQLLLVYVEQLNRDVSRYNDCQARLNFCPLGACDLAGTYLPIDRSMTALELGFTNPMRNSIDAVSDRDFVLEFLNVNSSTASHLSRLGEDWALWASEDCGFITSSGHSIMQQKMHPHPMELVRKKAALVTGCLMSVLKSNALPFTYKQDFQEDRKAMFNSFRTIVGMIDISEEFTQRVRFNQDRIKNSLWAGHLNAITLGAFLVKKGYTVIQSLDEVDKAAGVCVSRGRKLENVSLEELKELFTGLDYDGLKRYLLEESVNGFCSEGSTGPYSVEFQLQYWISELGMTST